MLPLTHRDRHIRLVRTLHIPPLYQKMSLCHQMAQIPHNTCNSSHPRKHRNLRPPEQRIIKDHGLDNPGAWAAVKN